ncbi:MAG: RNA 2',3'-cyclic phosphodiesterase [Anaerolineales bacterium]|nr:RNA 2',3'-cyclic phosphodiesterase [Anaerolineales bacterium]
MNPSVRAFIAIGLSADVRRWLIDARAGLERKIPSGAVRWTDPGGIHLTLKFLGEISTARIGGICEVMDGLASFSRPFLISPGGLGCFPDARRLRVIWAGVRADPQLTDLQKRLEVDLEKIGFPAERRAFSPHLTLGRVRDGVPSGSLEELGRVVKDSAAGSAAGMEVKEINLFSSVLRPGGAEYSVLHRSPFSG